MRRCCSPVSVVLRTDSGNNALDQESEDRAALTVLFWRGLSFEFVRFRGGMIVDLRG
jgi:hypothetical protein